MDEPTWTIEVEYDKPGRRIVVTVEEPSRDPGPTVTLGMPAGPLGAEWTWLSATEAQEIADALLTAAAVVERTAGEEAESR